MIRVTEDRILSKDTDLDIAPIFELLLESEAGLEAFQLDSKIDFDECSHVGNSESDAFFDQGAAPLHQIIVLKTSLCFAYDQSEHLDSGNKKSTYLSISLPRRNRPFQYLSRHTLGERGESICPNEYGDDKSSG